MVRASYTQLKRIAVLSLILLSGAVLVSAAEKVDEFQAETALVTLDGQVLFKVRGMAGYSASERAQAITKRIQTVASNPQISADAVTIEQLPDRSNLVAGDILMVSILDSDAAIEKASRTIMSERVRLNIIEAISDYRHDRTSPVLIRRTIIALAATVGIILLLGFILRIFRKLLTICESHIKTKMESLELKSSQIIRSGPLWTMVTSVLNGGRFLLIAGLVYFYLNLVLGLYPWTRSLAARLFSLFVEPFQILGLKFLDALPGLAFIAVLALIVRYLLKVMKLFFAGVNQGTITIKDFDSDWAWPTYRIVRILTVCFALVVAFPYIPGSNTDAFKGVSLFVGVLFSLGSTSVIANMIASIALTYRRAFKVGDMIKVNEITGHVTDMRIQAINVKTIYNEVVVIPNAIVVNSHIINYSRLAKTEGVVLHTTVGIGYQTPWRQVEAMLLIAASQTEGIKKEPKPFVRKRALETFYVQYELNVYCEEPGKMLNVYSDLHKNIVDVFNEHGVQIMTPAYEGDPQDPKVVPKDKFFVEPAKPSN